MIHPENNPDSLACLAWSLGGTPVTLIAEVEVVGGNRKVPVMISGTTSMGNLRRVAAVNLAAQHPILAGRPIAGFSYPKGGEQ